VESSQDEKLVEACLRGEGQAYAELGKLYARRVYTVCLAIVGSAADAQDLTQETLVRGFTELASLRDRNSFGPWIVAIASNLSRDFYRRRAAEKSSSTVLDDCAVGDANELAGEPERLIDLRRALRELPEHHRIPLLLYYFDGHSTESVAVTLGISPAAVHQRMSRARRELRKLLETREVRDE